MLSALQLGAASAAAAVLMLGLGLLAASTSRKGLVRPPAK